MTLNDDRTNFSKSFVARRREDIMLDSPGPFFFFVFSPAAEGAGRQVTFPTHFVNLEIILPWHVLPNGLRGK